MKKAKTVISGKASKPMRPALTPEARENQLISLAVDLAEQQLRDGTASSQVITHYLKLGSTRERKELEILEQQKKLYEAKAKSYDSSAEIKDLYKGALAAMKSYSGQGGTEEDVD